MQWIWMILELVLQLAGVILIFVVMLFVAFAIIAGFLGYHMDKNSWLSTEPILDKADTKLMAMITSLQEDMNNLKNDLTKLKENDLKTDMTNLLENDSNLVYQQGMNIHYTGNLIFSII